MRPARAWSWPSPGPCVGGHNTSIGGLSGGRHRHRWRRSAHGGKAADRRALRRIGSPRPDRGEGRSVDRAERRLDEANIRPAAGAERIAVADGFSAAGTGRRQYDVGREKRQPLQPADKPSPFERQHADMLSRRGGRVTILLSPAESSTPFGPMVAEVADKKLFACGLRARIGVGMRARRFCSTMCSPISPNASLRSNAAFAVAVAHGGQTDALADALIASGKVDRVFRLEQTELALSASRFTGTRRR